MRPPNNLYLNASEQRLLTFINDNIHHTLYYLIMPAFKVIFVIVDVLALGSSAVLILGSIIPFMYVVLTNQPPRYDSAFFGPFSWYHSGKLESKENITVFFRFIQVMYAVSLVSSFLGSVAAIFGYLNEKFQKRVGYFVIVCSVPLGLFSISYTIHYIYTLSQASFISILVAFTTLKTYSDTLATPRFMLSVWSMTIVFVALGILVLVHKFDNDGN
ncbi:hypothetical protein RF11_06930 [Thelohanellus kitauei]|uniref:Uncharacterized protein n=1 Tax=Thelohanellus kitauei TaxID=669202 RepID=A0A0C2N3N6_THEKT|nr:hypothetical protein RF11_06930 [Thelohanellus kitauei]